MASAGHRELDAWAAASIVNQELKPAQPSPKKSRRAAQKRVVSIPIGDAEGHRPKNAAGEGFPPTDSWAWRKYGQKPIKGSPYPRGYYRCSSWKGCPARKQVERSRLDPSLLTITYSFDHNHPWPHPRSGRHHQNRLPPAPPPQSAEQHTPPHPPQPTSMSLLAEAAVSKPEEKQPDEKEPLMMVEGGGLEWFSDVASPSSTSAGSDELLYGSVLFGGTEVGLVVPEEWEAVGKAEEDSLFAGLGELPEYSVVLRRGLAAAPWMGSTG